MKCGFSRTCRRYNTDHCNNNCYPYVVLHGVEGNSGVWSSRGIPKKYLGCLKDNLCLHDKKVQQRVENYISKMDELVRDKHVGLYLFGTTGTGKTTTACTVLNEYTIFRTKLHMVNCERLGNMPTYFIRVSELQNLYNAMYRGTTVTKDENADRFSVKKKLMKSIELLVIDDIALRDTTEGFRNELYDIIDYRATNSLTTIFTSNIDLKNLSDFVGERIASRIEGMCVPLLISGPDMRSGGCW